MKRPDHITDVAEHLWLGLGTALGSKRTSVVPPLRDQGVDLATHLGSNAYHLQRAAKAEIAQAGLVDGHDPALTFIRLAKVDAGRIVALIVRVDSDRITALNAAPDGFLDDVWSHLTGETLDLGPAP